MTRASWPIRVALLIAVAAGFLVASDVLVRPRLIRWGATDAEVSRPLPGDDIAPGPARQETRAITIDAPVERVWPWLAQLGRDRGGFYSYDLLENAVGCELPDRDLLRPDRQHWNIGDRLWMYPERRMNGTGFAVLRTYQPGRVLGFGTHTPGSPQHVEDGSWTFMLVPMGTQTRLIIRGRNTHAGGLLSSAFDRLIFTPMHFVMERRTMMGLKALAETGQRSRVANNMQVFTWIITCAILGACVVLTLIGRRWRHALATAACAAAVFAVLTLVQPSPLVSAFLALLPLALFVNVRRSR